MASKAGVRAIPLLDLTRQYQPLREPMQVAIARVIESQRFILWARREVQAPWERKRSGALVPR